MDMKEAMALQKQLKAKRPNKYWATKVKVDGVTYHSTGEMHRHKLLQRDERVGLVRALQHQWPFELRVNGELIATYVADFVYDRRTNLDDLRHPPQWEPVVEDFKSPATRAIDTYIIKKKLMKAIYGITIYETGKKK